MSKQESAQSTIEDKPTITTASYSFDRLAVLLMQHVGNGKKYKELKAKLEAYIAAETKGVYRKGYQPVTRNICPVCKEIQENIKEEHHE